MAAVERVGEYAAANRSQEQLNQCMLDYCCRYALENNRRLIRALVTQVQRTMASMQFGDTVDRIRISEAFEEALLNAMFHGNLEIGKQELAAVRGELDDGVLDRLIQQRCTESHIRDRKILAVVQLKEDEARFVIRDEGRGFNNANVAGEAAPDRFTSGKCRGMTLMHTMMDEVRFNKAGNELVMSKRVQTASGETPEQAGTLPA
jgi:anti-sigma regulatory factor (Ser/Thr protein kinase)